MIKVSEPKKLFSHHFFVWQTFFTFVEAPKLFHSVFGRSILRIFGGQIALKARLIQTSWQNIPQQPFVPIV